MSDRRKYATEAELRRLERRLRRSGCTQYELARTYGVDPGTVSRWLSGQRRVLRWKYNALDGAMRVLENRL